MIMLHIPIRIGPVVLVAVTYGVAMKFVMTLAVRWSNSENRMAKVCSSSSEQFALRFCVL